MKHPVDTSAKLFTSVLVWYMIMYAILHTIQQIQKLIDLFTQ